MTTSRKSTIIILIALTFVLGIAVIVISIRLSQSQAPTDASAAAGDSCTANGSCVDVGLSCSSGIVITDSACNLCGTVGDCYAANTGLATGAIYCLRNGVQQICCPTGQTKVGTQCAPITTTPPAAPPRKAYCGESCSTSSDCATLTAGGVQPICSGGLCVNPDCPTDTNFGSICTCGSANVRTCGQTCGQQASGATPSSNCGANAICGNSAATGGDGNNYCLPTNNSAYVTQGGSCGMDPNPGLFCIKRADGTVVNTQTEIIQACAVCGDMTCSAGENAITCPGDCAACGDSICSPTENTASCAADCPIADVCGDGLCSGTETPINCPADCHLPSLPATALFDDETDTLLFGFMAIVLGVLMLKFDLVNRGINYFGLSSILLQQSGLKGRNKHLSKDRAKFEKKFKRVV
jgi:hypothetical protein